ncbi:unnamed protein product [Closterium sp. NIES-54]
MPPPKPTAMQLRAWFALSAALWLAASGVSPCHALPAAVINATQAAFLEDCQNAWGKTFPGWARGAYCDEISGVSCDYSGMITTIDSTANFNGSIPDSISSLTSLSRLGTLALPKLIAFAMCLTQTRPCSVQVAPPPPPPPPLPPPPRTPHHPHLPQPHPPCPHPLHSLLEVPLLEPLPFQ